MQQIILIVNLSDFFFLKIKLLEIPDSLLRASRICNETGKWHGDWTNYTACFARALPRLWESMQKDEEEAPEDLPNQEVSNFV